MILRQHHGQVITTTTPPTTRQEEDLLAGQACLDFNRVVEDVRAAR
jgi:hypothetical protein